MRWSIAKAYIRSRNPHVNDHNGPITYSHDFLLNMKEMEHWSEQPEDLVHTDCRRICTGVMSAAQLLNGSMWRAHRDSSERRRVTALSSSAPSETGDLKGKFAGMTAVESVEQKSKAKVRARDHNHT